MDKQLIEEKINLITRDLSRLRQFSDEKLENIAEDFIKYSALKNILMEIIGRAIDVNSHIIAESSIEEDPKNYRETFLLLGKFNILPDYFSEEISKSAGFRNAIVHDYDELDKVEIYKTVGDAIRQYRDYCEYILDYLESK